ncbi:unnamed protein product [Miscanthus lutarioriparius]|uniref:Uncharacterized protein n=1 Tax=Miscanthus lutarioriparius TaxID=422564 RepID=A0A811R133_9POAL|nr:unnamed protein product [Miscanthus lutarioriparius]
MHGVARKLMWGSSPVGAAGSDRPDDHDVVIVLASLLCALITVLGIGLVARCACGRGRAQAAANRGVKKSVLRKIPTVPYVAPASAAGGDAAESGGAGGGGGGGVRHLPGGVRGGRVHARAAPVRPRLPRRLHRQVAAGPLVLPFLPPDPVPSSCLPASGAAAAARGPRTGTTLGGSPPTTAPCRRSWRRRQRNRPIRKRSNPFG